MSEKIQQTLACLQCPIGSSKDIHITQYTPITISNNHITLEPNDTTLNKNISVIENRTSIDETDRLDDLSLYNTIITKSRIHSYERIREIGTGSFGKALLVKSMEADGTAKQYVMKIIDTGILGPKERRDAINEVKVLSSLKHPYIISYKESFLEDGHLCIIMDYADGGDLFRAIGMQRRRGLSFSENQILRWFTQAVLALKYLHEKHILHRDLKSQNLFLMSNGRLRLGDFGIAKMLDGTTAFAKTQIGTPYYLSPEICKNQPYSWAADIWSLGCILYELATLKVPFDAPNIGVLLKKITSQQPPSLPDTFSTELQTLYLDCLHREWRKRPSASDILQRNIIQNEIRGMLFEEQKKRKRKCFIIPIQSVSFGPPLLPISEQHNNDLLTKQINPVEVNKTINQSMNNNNNNNNNISLKRHTPLLSLPMLNPTLSQNDSNHRVTIKDVNEPPQMSRECSSTHCLNNNYPSISHRMNKKLPQHMDNRRFNHTPQQETKDNLLNLQNDLKQISPHDPHMIRCCSQHSNISFHHNDQPIVSLYEHQINYTVLNKHKYKPLQCCHQDKQHKKYTDYDIIKPMTKVDHPTDAFWSQSTCADEPQEIKLPQSISYTSKRLIHNVPNKKIVHHITQQDSVENNNYVKNSETNEYLNTTPMRQQFVINHSLVQPCDHNKTPVAYKLYKHHRLNGLKYKYEHISEKSLPSVPYMKNNVCHPVKQSFKHLKQQVTNDVIHKQLSQLKLINEPNKRCEISQQHYHKKKQLYPYCEHKPNYLKSTLYQSIMLKQSAKHHPCYNKYKTILNSLNPVRRHHLISLFKPSIDLHSIVSPTVWLPSKSTECPNRRRLRSKSIVD